MPIPHRGAVLLLLALVPLAAGQTEKQAISQTKAAIKQAVKGFKAACKEQQASLDARLVLLAGDLDGATTTSEAVLVVANEVTEVLDEVDQALHAAWLDIADGGSGALELLSDGASLDGDYPDKLYAGAGTLAAGAQASLNKLAAKLQASFEKQLLEFAAQMEKETGLRFAILVRLPANPREFVFNEGASMAADFTGARIDLVVTASRGDVDHDGAIVVAGLVSQPEESVTMFAQSAVDSDGKNDFADVTGRFILPGFSNGSLEEGNYFARVYQENTFSATVTIGMR